MSVLKNGEQGIICKAPIVLKVLPLIIWALLALSYKPAGNGSDLFFAAIWAFLGFMYFVSVQDFIFYNEGIEIRIWWMRTFVNWENVQSAYYYSLKTQLYVKQTTPPSFLMKLFIHSSTGILWFFSDYDLAVQILEEQLGKHFFGGVKQKH